ncbi:hypothetical protein [Baekduia soli]|uniref:hypothetical protein n=1 Tax=Baekduia soli TaxID=496014 RepID=UPI001652721B|nr:hypothetical protein [Baekduia soli]
MLRGLTPTGTRAGTSRSGWRRRLGLAIAAGSVAIEAAAIRRRGYPIAGKVVVRCRDGHLFTTLWIPGASVKALRLGPWRIQRCPVGRHWSLVTPVRRAGLSPEQRRLAAAARDVGLP